MSDDKIIANITARFAAKKKLTSTQLEVLENPDRLRTATQVKTAEKLVEMGLLEKRPRLWDPDAVYYIRTQEGQKYLDDLEDAKDDLTRENIGEIAHKFPDLVSPRVDLDRLCINLVIRDAAHGNTIVRRVKKVPSNQDIEKIVNDMLGDMKHRAQKTRERWKYIPR